MVFSILYVFFHIYLFLILVYAIENFILNINIQLIVINVKKQNFIIFEFLLNSHIFQHQEIHYLVYFIYKVLSFVSEYTNFFLLEKILFCLLFTLLYCLDHSSVDMNFSFILCSCFILRYILMETKTVKIEYKTL